MVVANLEKVLDDREWHLKKERVLKFEFVTNVGVGKNERSNSCLSLIK